MELGVEEMKNIEVGKLIKYNRARRGFKQKELAKLIYEDEEE